MSLEFPFDRSGVTAEEGDDGKNPVEEISQPADRMVDHGLSS